MNSSSDTIRNGLKIIIVGCGKVGSTLVEKLSREGHDITIIDKNASKVHSIVDLYDIVGVTGNGASYGIQMEAGIEDTDLLIAVTDSDELNLLCCTVAGRTSKCAAIARVRTPDYSEETGYLREKLGLAMIINPELEAAKEMARILYFPTALEVNTFAHGMAELIKFKVPTGNIMAGKTISQLSRLVSTSFLICAIERGGSVIIPKGDFTFNEGDFVSLVAKRSGAKQFFKKTGFNTHQVKDTIIVGGGTVAYYLAKQLISGGIAVKIIEADKTRCVELSILLPEAIIINGDGTDEELLKEEGITYAESFIPLTGIDEENIMLTLYVKRVSGAKVITKINRINFRDVVNSLDLGSVIYPRFITCEAIIAYVRAKKNAIGSNNIMTLYHLFDSRMEAVEFIVQKASRVTDTPIMDLPIKKDLLICFIYRKGRLLIPGGRDTIQIGDMVMIVTTHTGFDDIDDILQ